MPTVACGDLRQQRLVQGANGPVLAVQAVADEGLDQPGFGPEFLGEANDRREIALEIAAGKPEAGRQIGIGADPAVELERRRDLRPVGADPLAQLGERVGDA